jgi:ribosomal protein S18 acetylase RimI-like enzyme
MEIRPVESRDLDLLTEIDGTIESASYVHVERSGEGMGLSWKLQERPLRERRVVSNAIDDERRFILRQIVSGAEEGLARMIEHDSVPVALIVASADVAAGVMRIHELRVDYDQRRQGLATALVYQVINIARERELRAVAAETKTDNSPAAQLLAKCGFDVAGLDAQRYSNHDLVKETVALFWYAALD